jgi:NAD(P)-dependent dehydrogenase (short-subunit alcohol dehydrogenase family)
MGKLSNEVVLVVGGSSGLGRASVEACAAEGGCVVIADIDERQALQTVASVEAAGGKAVFIRTDGADEAQIKASVDCALETYGGLDVLIHSIGASGNLYDDAGWHRAIDLFLKSPYYACKYAVREMEKRGGGSIVNIASIAGVTGSISMNVEGTGYPSAKHGLIGMTRTLALAYASKNIRVNAICPGYFKTAMTAILHDSPDGGLGYIKDHLRVPLARWGDPKEIGTVAVFLASDDASFITGQPIIVDGGFMAR